MTLQLFYTLSAVAIISAIFTIGSKKPIYSILSLIVCLYAIGAIYILLNATLFAIVHLIVYAGAIMVLFLFIVMLMNLNLETPSFRYRFIRLIGIMIGTTFGIALVWSAAHSPIQPMVQQLPATGKQLGLLLFKHYAIPFELTTVLFLAAVVGVVTLAKERQS